MTRPIRLRVGLIGASAGGSWGTLAHVPALRGLPDVELAAIATTRQETADATAHAIGVTLAFGDPFAMIADDRIDAVAVAVRVPAHKVFVDAAIAAGKHVYCEWPLGIDTAEAQSMLDAATWRGVVHMVGLQARQAPALRYARDMLADGAIGTVIGCSLSHCEPWAYAADSRRAYLEDRRTGAHFLSIPGGHSLDAMRFLLGELALASALLRRSGGNDDPALSSANQVAVTAILASGGAAMLRMVGTVQPGRGIRFEINGTTGHLLVKAEPGSRGFQMAELDLFRTDTSGTFQPLVPPAEYREHNPVQASPAMQVAGAYQEFAAAIRDGRPATPGFDEAVRLHHLLDDIERLAERHHD